MLMLNKKYIVKEHIFFYTISYISNQYKNSDKCLPLQPGNKIHSTNLYCYKKPHSLVTDQDASSDRGFSLTFHTEISFHLDLTLFFQLLSPGKCCPILWAKALRENQMATHTLHNIIVLTRSTDKRLPTFKLWESFFCNPPGTWRLFMLPLTAYAVHTYNT